MKEKLIALWNFALGLLLYPVAFILLVWLWWTGGHWGWGLLVIGVLLALDPTWLTLVASLFRRGKNK